MLFRSIAGTYNVTVTDTKGCTASTTATVTGPLTALSVALASQGNVTCNGLSNGTISLNVSGGTGAYSYAWSGTGSGTNPRSGLAAGTYIVTVTDANGCTATLSRTITQPPVLVISLLKTDPICPPGAAPPENSNGAIQVTATGGTVPYNVNWSGTSSGGPVNAPGGVYTITNLTAGTYTVTVIDANSCTTTGTITLNALNALPNPPSGINNN